MNRDKSETERPQHHLGICILQPISLVVSNDCVIRSNTPADRKDQAQSEILQPFHKKRHTVRTMTAFDSAWEFDDSLLALPDELPNIVEEDDIVIMETTTKEESSHDMSSNFEPLPWIIGSPARGKRKTALLQSVDDVTISDDLTEVTSNIATTRFVSPYHGKSRRLSLDDGSMSSSAHEQACHDSKRHFFSSSNHAPRNLEFPLQSTSSGFSFTRRSSYKDDASSAGDDLASVSHCYYYTGRQRQSQQQEPPRSSPTSHDTSHRRIISCMRNSDETRTQLLAQLQVLPSNSEIRATTNINYFYNTCESRDQLLSCYADSCNHECSDKYE
jgi:hypothetical protein